MSEENKNPLIEAVLKLHEFKNPGRGGKDEPYQGRNLQPHMNPKFIPAALRVKDSAPAAQKTTPSTSSSAAAPVPKPKPTGPVVVPTSGPPPSSEISAAQADDKLSRSAPNAAAAYAARKLNTTNTTTTDNSVEKKISDTARSTADSAKEYVDAGAKKLESGVESGKNYVSGFMKWLRSKLTEETLQEFYGGTAQDKITMQQRIRNAAGSQLGGFGNREVTTLLPADTQTAPAPIPPRPAMDTAPKPQPSMSLQRQQSGDVAPKPQPSMSLQRQQSGDVAPKIDNSASMNRAKTDYQTRVGGVERQNPILAPGKLEGGNLQMGSRGESVKELQRKLGIKDDGIFGPQTAAALKAFQQKNNLKVDAIYGRQSASAMNRQSGMEALKKENPVGAALTAKSVTPISPMANQTQPRIVSDRTNFLKNNNRDRMESTEMSNKLIEAFMQLHKTNSSNLFAEAKKAKKLDPVGKEDEDIDNDGDKDKSDSYLHNRRKAIASAMKEAKDPNAEGMVKAGTKAPEMTTKPEYATQSKEQTPNRAAKTSLPKGVTAKQTNEAASPMAGQGSSGDKTAKRDLPMLPAASLAGARQASRESGEIGSRQRSMIDSVKKSAFDAKTPGEKVSAFGKALGARVAEPFVKAVDAAKGYETPQSKVVKTGKNSSTVMKNEEVEQLEEAAFKLTDAHKSAITKHLKNSLGKGKVTFHSEHGGRFATHSDGIQSTVHHIQMKNGKMSLSHFMTMDEEFEQLEEMRSALLTQDHADAKDMTPEQKKAKHKRFLDIADEHGKRMKDQSLTQNQRMASSSVHTAAKMAAAEWKNKYMKEEIEFSEAELEHIASIVEAVAPTPEDHASNATPENNATGGKGRGSMTEEDAVKRGRGRPKGSKSGSKHGEGGNAAGVTHLVDQIKHAGTRGISDGKGNYMLKHEHGTNRDGSPKVHTAAVPQKAANDFYRSYHGTEKPAAKQELHDKFVAKHFGITKAAPKQGISLASMPRPKS